MVGKQKPKETVPVQLTIKANKTSSTNVRTVRPTEGQVCKVEYSKQVRTGLKMLEIQLSTQPHLSVTSQWNKWPTCCCRLSEALVDGLRKELLPLQETCKNTHHRVADQTHPSRAQKQRQVGNRVQGPSNALNTVLQTQQMVKISLKCMFMPTNWQTLKQKKAFSRQTSKLLFF